MQALRSQPSTADPRWEEVRRLLPLVEGWLAVVGDLLRADVVDTTMTAEVVPCQESAAPLAEECGDARRPSPLPAPQGAVLTNPHAPIEAMSYDADNRARLRDVFEQFKACQSELTGRQWTVVALLYREGLTQTETAKRLSKSRSAVSDLHTRANETLSAYQRRLRKEAFELARRHLDSPE